MNLWNYFYSFIQIFNLVLALSCVVPAQLAPSWYYLNPNARFPYYASRSTGQAATPLRSDWLSIPDQESESLMVNNAVGQNLNFRRLTSRLDTLEDTTEILNRKLKGIRKITFQMIDSKRLKCIISYFDSQNLWYSWRLLPVVLNDRCKVWQQKPKWVSWKPLLALNLMT
jgi:hypothetical protein